MNARSFSLPLLLAAASVFSVAGCAKKQALSTAGQPTPAASTPARPSAAFESPRLQAAPEMREHRLPAPVAADPRPLVPTAEATPRAGTFAGTEERRLAPPPGTGAAEQAPDRAVAGPRAPSGLSRVYFEFDQATLPPAARETLAANAKYLRANQGVRLLIEGHCDERGTTGYNLALGEKRAKTVQRYLTDLGIDPNRMSVVTYGEEVPLDPRHREEAWAKNRRAEFVKVGD